MNNTIYGYGHTKEASTLVRNLLKQELKSEIGKYSLTISVRKANSGYGGPRVDITTPRIELDSRYEYIIGDDGLPANSGRLVSRPVSEFTFGRPDGSAQLVKPEATEKLNSKIKTLLNSFGEDEDDAMTDYFNNTQPLFYGVSYEA